MADEITELCSNLLAAEDPDEFHARATELRSAVGRRVHGLRENPHGVRLAAQLASILAMYQAGQSAIADRLSPDRNQSDDGERRCPPTANPDLSPAQSGAN